MGNYCYDNPELEGSEKTPFQFIYPCDLDGIDSRRNEFYRHVSMKIYL